MIIGLERAHRLAGDARDFLIAQLVIVAQVEGDAPDVPVEHAAILVQLLLESLVDALGV